VTTLGGNLVHGDPVEGTNTPARLAERQASRASELPVTPSLGSRSRSLARRIAVGVVPYLSHQAQYVGRVGVIGVALLVFSIVCFLSANSPLRQQIAAVQADLAQTQQDQQKRSGSGRDRTPAAQLQAFVSGLPARTQLPAITEQIVAQASAAGLVLEQGSYDFTVTHSGRIVRARLSFPLQGTYPSIRQFVNGTLAAIPDAAVDGLRLEHKTIGLVQVSANVRFAVFLRNDQ
jgi:hypothetical protein